MRDILQIEEAKLKRIIDTCSKELEHAPEGFLYIKKRKKRIDCYQAVNRKDDSGRWVQDRSYIPQSNLELIGDLQQKKLRSKQLAEAQKKLKAILQCKKAYGTDANQGYVEALCDKYGNTVTYRCSQWDSEIKAWMNQREQYNTKHPENKRFRTMNGIDVRSKSELLIANTLESYNIPYKYDILLELNGQIISPDFKILRPYDKKLFLWEHYGLIWEKTYAANADRKKLIYRASGYLPWNNLIETYDDEKGGIDARMIDTIIKGIFLI